MQFHATTIVLVKRSADDICIGGDGQVTMGEHAIMKNNAKKVRKIYKNSVITGFAGSVSDAFSLTEKFEKKLEEHGGNLKRAAVALAQTWRSDGGARNLEAMMLAADKESVLLISGTGEVIEPDEDFLEGVRELADGKFRTWEWIYGHSREADFCRSAVLPCGTVSVQTRTDHGLISEVSFSGDFMGDLPSEELSAVLSGVRLGYGPVLDVLRTVDVGSFFYGAEPDEIAGLIVPEGV